MFLTNVHIRRLKTHVWELDYKVPFVSFEFDQYSIIFTRVLYAILCYTGPNFDGTEMYQAKKTKTIKTATLATICRANVNGNETELCIQDEWHKLILF